PPAIEIYAENGIDLKGEPLEIAVCAQHNNGGFAVSKWWESNIPRTFIVGEMAGTHGVKRPGGSALNAGQVGGLRAAQYIANVYSADGAGCASLSEGALEGITEAAARLGDLFAKGRSAKVPAEAAMDEIRNRMTRYGAHLRGRKGAGEALAAALAQYRRLVGDGVATSPTGGPSAAVMAIQQCLTQVAMLKAIVAMFERSAGSRGSHCILDENGREMHPALAHPETGKPYRFLEENKALREEILCVTYDEQAADLFETRLTPVRPIPARDIAFEPAWTEYREGQVFRI
ncbi:MAG: hypothetical protein ACYTAN_13290, partial [Planctomycetota bacterium]